MNKYKDALNHYIALEKSLGQDSVNKELLEHTRVAIKAIERQIPKTPDIEGDSVDSNGELIYDTWYCPNCDVMYEIGYDRYDYCPNCGQAIYRNQIEDYLWE